MKRLWAAGGVWSRVFATAWAVAGLMAGCSPSYYRQDADRVGYKIVDEAQRRAVGKTEPFTVERPGDTLRRRLLIGQDLPMAGPASLGSMFVPRVEHWPEKDYPATAPATAPDELTVQSDEPLKLSLNDALEVAARSSREYQSRKEQVFSAALDLDLAANLFRNILGGTNQGRYIADLTGVEDVQGLVDTTNLTWQRRLKNGTLLTAGFAMDLVQLLTQEKTSSLGMIADASINVPLLRGAGEYIVTEPLTQAERNVVYAVWDFERFKGTLAVAVAASYLDILRQLDQIRNAEDNYKRLIGSTRRAQRLADAGRLPQIQVDQARQDELRARDRWVSAQQDYQNRLDTFKITLGLPADANIDLDHGELDRLTQELNALVPAGTKASTVADTEPAETMPAWKASSGPTADEAITLEPPRRQGGGRMEIPETQAMSLALTKRLDMRTALGKVVDAQRKVVVAANALEMGLNLTGSANAGQGRALSSANRNNASIDLDRGLYALGFEMDLPLERTAERNAYRQTYLNMEQAVRDAQELEDTIKKQIRDALRQMLATRESFIIQAQAVELAKRRVTSTELFLQAGRAAIRDVLDAQESLVSAQDALTTALVSYRIAELQLQRDMGVLDVDEKGIWREYKP